MSLSTRTWILTRSLLLWGWLGILEGKRFQSTSVPLHTHNTHHIPSHTPKCQHFICRILHCQTPALPGILRFQENESSCFPLHKKAGTLGMKGHHARPSAWALPVLNSIINTPLIYALFPPPQCWSHSGMCNWMLAACILKSILACLSIALWDPLWGNPWGFKEGKNPAEFCELDKLFDCSGHHFLHLKTVLIVPTPHDCCKDAHEMFLRCLVLNTGSIEASHLHRKSMWVLPRMLPALFWCFTNSAKGLRGGI